MKNGIINIGNTCYMNSILQCLNNLNVFSQDDSIFLKHCTILSEKNNFNLMKEWLLLIKDINSEEKKNVDPKKFMNCFIHEIKQNNYFFQSFNQNDSSEFLNIFLDLLHKCIEYKLNIEYSGEIKNKYDKIAVDSINRWKDMFNNNYSYIIKKTYNQLLSIINCPECNYITQSHDPLQIITLDIKDETTLYELFDSYTNIHNIDNDCIWKCDRCKKNVNPYIKNSFWNLADILIIQLKRYSINGNKISKNNTYIEYPNILDMDNYTLNYFGNNNKYQLQSLSIQNGGLNGGHYYSICKENRKWICYNDTQVSEISEQKTFNNNPYCLFYKRI